MLLKKILLLTLVFCIITQPFGDVYATETLQNILLYHEMAETLPEENNTYYIEREMFYKQMVYIKENCTILSIDEFIEYFNKGELLPDNAVVVTFDDGYASTYTLAYPILKELNIPATVFITTDAVGEEGHATWQQINEMLESGIITIGSHGCRHMDFTALEDDELYAQLYDSKTVIEHNTGIDCKYIAYPYGLGDDNLVELAKIAGYDAGFVTYSTRIEDTMFGFKRSLINCNDNLYTLKNVILKNYIMGDVNGDGVVRFKDVCILKNYVVGKYDKEIDVYAADINGDGAVTFKDSVLMRNMYIDSCRMRYSK